MEDEGLHPSESETGAAAQPLQSGQCWRLKEAVPPFADLVVLLAPVRTTAGDLFWEVLVPLADLADRLLQLAESSRSLLALPGRAGQEEMSAEETMPPGPTAVSMDLASSAPEYAPPGELADGVIICIREDFLQTSLLQLVAQGLVPSEVRRQIRTSQHAYWSQTFLEDALTEASQELLWEPDLRRSASPENFLQALQQADAEALANMLEDRPSLLEQWLPRRPSKPCPSSSGHWTISESVANFEQTANPSVPAVEPEMAPAPALVWAVRLGHPEIVRFLLDKGADPNGADAEGNRPLHWAARLGQVEIAQMVLEHGAALDRPNQAGHTPLLLAARSPAWDGPRVAQLLLDAGAQADLNSLVALGRVEEVLQYLDKNPSGLAAAPEPDNLLEDALWAIRRAISRRMDPAITDPETLDALMAEYLPMLERLLQAGADPNAGFPLWTAVQLPDPRPAALLLRWRADPNRKIHENMFPLEVARTASIRQLLQQYGAKDRNDPTLVVQRESQRLAQCPEDTEALRRRAEAWAGLGRFQEALADWAALIQLAPEQPDGYLGQAWIWASCPQAGFRDGQAALQSARRAVELAGGWESLANQRVWDERTGQVSVRTEYWLTYASALAELAQFQEAVQVLEQVLPLCSAADRPRIRYFRSLFAAGQPYRIRPPEEEQLLYQQFAEEPAPPRGFWARLKSWLNRLAGLFGRQNDWNRQ